MTDLFFCATSTLFAFPRNGADWSCNYFEIVHSEYMLNVTAVYDYTYSEYLHNFDSESWYDLNFRTTELYDSYFQLSFSMQINNKYVINSSGYYSSITGGFMVNLVRVYESGIHIGVGFLGLLAGYSRAWEFGRIRLSFLSNGGYLIYALWEYVELEFAVKVSKVISIYTNAGYYYGVAGVAEGGSLEDAGNETGFRYNSGAFNINIFHRYNYSDPGVNNQSERNRLGFSIQYSF